MNGCPLRDTESIFCPLTVFAAAGSFVLNLLRTIGVDFYQFLA